MPLVCQELRPDPSVPEQGAQGHRLQTTDWFTKPIPRLVDQQNAPTFTAPLMTRVLWDRERYPERAGERGFAV
jgi:hypothetical protein